MELGAPKLFGETGYTTLERVWARPTFEVNGLLSGFTGEGAKTVLPAVAMAKVSMRLVPNQDPKKIGDLFEAYLKKVMPKAVNYTLTRMHGGKPWMTAFDNQYVQAAGRAIERGFGKTPVFNREGGSIPVVATFQEELGLPCVLFGVGLPDENAHAPDEKLDLGNFHNGVIASAALYEEIGRAAVRWSGPAAMRDGVSTALATFYGPLAPPPRDLFGFVVWEILSARALPSRRDMAWQALRRLPALTPDAMFRAPKADLQDALLMLPAARGADRRAAVGQRASPSPPRPRGAGRRTAASAPSGRWRDGAAPHAGRPGDGRCCLRRRPRAWRRPTTGGARRRPAAWARGDASSRPDAG